MSNIDRNFDIIGLSETWLNETNKDVYRLDGYINIPLVRPDRIHGGVSLFILDLISYIIESLKPHYQSCYLEGDYDIDLLKHSTHNPTSEILDLIFSNSFIPLINKPTRVTPKTATIIDKIFTKEYKIENKHLTGILTTDISDHYPIFHIAPFENKPQEDDNHLIYV